MGLALMGFGMKETKPFLKKKLESTSDKSEIKDLRRARFTAPFKLKTSRNKMIAFMIIGFLLGLMAAAISTFEDFLTTTIVDSGLGTPEQVNMVIYIATLGTFVFFGITGVLADKMGRKLTIYLYAGLNLVFFLDYSIYFRIFCY